MTVNQWKTYRTRFLVKAKQLNSDLAFTDPLGRHHCGRKGDYLVESCGGVISIAPRQIFEDIYVPMTVTNLSPDAQTRHTFSVEYLRQETATQDGVGAFSAGAAPANFPRRRRATQTQIPTARRKSPQPVGSPRVPARLGLM